MKNWVTNNKLYWWGAAIGAVAGFLYWKYVGCLTGSCAITSNPVRSTIYFSLFGSLLFGMFKRDKKREDRETIL
ncbi:MAG TPA: hypothetical protein VFD56_04645 [Chitinophagaceae bacterium]|nr:hypothetical protein [Chitinophagaceae bacterium]